MIKWPLAKVTRGYTQESSDYFPHKYNVGTERGEKAAHDIFSVLHHLLFFIDY